MRTGLTRFGRWTVRQTGDREAGNNKGCLCLPPDEHTHLLLPLSKHKEKEQSQTSTLISISQTSHARVTLTHTHTVSRTLTQIRAGSFQTCFGFRPRAHICTTWVLCLDSNHAHVKHAQPFPSLCWAPSSTAAAPVSHFTIHTTHWQLEPMAPSGETVNGSPWEKMKRVIKVILRNLSLITLSTYSSFTTDSTLICKPATVLLYDPWHKKQPLQACSINFSIHLPLSRYPSSISHVSQSNRRRWLPVFIHSSTWGRL